jgi:hypothetical protein
MRLTHRSNRPIVVTRHHSEETTMLDTSHAPSTDVIRVSDLGAVAYLLLLGHRVLGLEGRHGRRLFLFPAAASTDLGVFVTDPPVGAASYADALRRAKGIINTANLMA